MARVLDYQANFVLFRKLNTGNNIIHVGDVDRVACVIPELTRRAGRRKGVAGFILERYVHDTARARHAISIHIMSDQWSLLHDKKGINL